MPSLSFLTTSLRPSREPLSLQVARILRQAILSGEIASGEAIPPETAIASALGVGRSTVREALRILQAQGLLSGADTVSTKRPQVDATGAIPSAATALEAAMALGELPVDDLVELRLLIEQAAMREIVRTEAPLGEARAALDAMAESVSDPEAFHTADVAFHTALVEASANRAYALVMRVVRSAQAEHLRVALSARDDAEAPSGLIREHTSILAALEAGDAERACTLLHAHLVGFYSGEGA